MGIGSQILRVLVAVGTAMIGYAMHHSLLWSILDFFFWPLAWVKWIVYQEVTMSIIKQTFAWFFK